jgi:hypothetical protein
MVAVLTGRLGGPRVGEVPYVARILRDHGRVMPGGPGVVPGPAELRDLTERAMPEGAGWPAGHQGSVIMRAWPA